MNEGMVKNILSQWFEERGFETQENVQINSENKVDLIAKKENVEWIVEVKGDYDAHTEQYTVNFDTGMGQSLKSISKLDNETKYAICIPFSRTERGEKLSYRLILKKYSKSMVFEVLNIHIILVRDDESVEVIPPKDVQTFLRKIDPGIRAKSL
ncbi:hypothetical protein KAX75_00740 [candidate division WOR-3 bacterium]|nr:hypothetical protein [candidate division WOR-3 bacterium]